MTPEINPSASPLDTRQILRFWAPLSVTWLLMAVEGPFLAAVIARMADPKYNLAAYGVAFAIALVVEAPIIMIMSAATALVKNSQTYHILRRFTHALNILITVTMLIMVAPPVFEFLTLRLIGLPPEVARLTRFACYILIPWPAAIGYRRFYQGILIISNRTRRVAYGTMVRLLCMSGTAMGLFFLSSYDGVLVAAAALTMGVSGEALAIRLMVGDSKRTLTMINRSGIPVPYLGLRRIARFYTPLALMSILSLGVHPLVTFFVGWSPRALESLAVLPVINSLVFVFRALGLSYQEVAIALMSADQERYLRIRAVGSYILVGSTLGIGLITWTPLADFWFQGVSGLTPELAAFSLLPAQIMTLLPAQAVWISLQRAILVFREKTQPLSVATMIEMGGIGLVLYTCIFRLNINGAVAAAVSYGTGRFLANIYLHMHCRKTLHTLWDGK